MLELLVKVEAVQPMRTFAAGNGETVSALDIEVSKGRDRFIVTAFDKTAFQLKETPPVVGGFYWAEISFAVSGTEKRFQSVRLVSLSDF